MTKEFKTEIQYALQEDIMLIATDDEIRIRKGVWNYEEACLSLTGYSEEFTRCFHDVFDSLQTGQFSVGQLDDLLLEPFERTSRNRLTTVAGIGFYSCSGRKTLTQSHYKNTYRRIGIIH